MKRVVVTGASGFIGSHVSRFLAQSGHSVTGVYRHHKPDFNDIDDVGIEYKNCDLSNKKEVYSLFDENSFDVIIHLGGQMRGDKVIDYLNNSVRTTENLINMAEKHDVKCFVFASSIAVYGYVDGIVDELSDSVSPDDYALAKRICERLLEDSSVPFRLSVRLPRVLGKGMDFSYPWIPRLVDKLMKNEDVYFFNPDMLYNNLAYVDTFCDYINNYIVSPIDDYLLIGIGASEPLSVYDIILILKEELGSTSKLIEKKNELPRNTCHLININKAIIYGYNPLTVEKTLKKVSLDLTCEG